MQAHLIGFIRYADGSAGLIFTEPGSQWRHPIAVVCFKSDVWDGLLSANFNWGSSGASAMRCLPVNFWDRRLQLPRAKTPSLCRQVALVSVH